MADDIIMTVYDPPKPGFPFLAVAIFPDGEAIATPYPTAAEAERHVRENAAIALKNRP
jgi:hypothetical protein